MKTRWKPYQDVKYYADESGHGAEVRNGVINIIHPVFDSRWFNFYGHKLGIVDLRFGRIRGKLIGD